MEEQNFNKHAKTVPMFHFVIFPLSALTFIGSLVNLYQSIGDHSRLYNASLITALSFIAVIHVLLSRVFPLKAQDRAIRAEEGLRYYILTGKRLDPRLTMSQIVGLRFAPDAEFPDLARRAADESLPLKTIKQSVKNWRADYDRL
jgi:Family of unknown function (DUF6526)